MSKKRILYCKRCNEKTVHKFVHKEVGTEGLGPLRGYFAVISLGLTEFVGATRYYKCTECGKIRDIDEL